MSLDICNKESVFCNMDSTDYFTKIIYNRLIPGYDYTQNISLLETIYSQIADNISNDDFLKNSFNKIENLYINPPNVEKHKYIFIPRVSNDAKKELQKIEKNLSYDNVNLGVLIKEFNTTEDKLFSSIGDINLSKVSFVEFYINKHESVNFLFSVLGHYLNSEDGDIFDKDGIYIYQNNIIQNEIYDIKNKIISEYKKGDASTFSVSTLKSILNQYLIPINIQNTVLQKYDYDTTNIVNMLDEPVITRFIEKYAKFRQMGYQYRVRNRLEYPVDSYIFNYFSDKNPVYETDITLSQFGLQEIERNYTLEYNNNPKDNTYFVYNIKNILDNLENNNIVTKNVTVDSITPIYKHFVKKVFPKLDTNSLLSLRNRITPDKDSQKKQNEIFNNYSIISTSYNLYGENNKTGMINIKFINNYILSISHRLILPPQFDLRNVFNELMLSYDIPFVKYKDRLGYKDVIYKLYKPITKKKSYNYRPTLTKDTLNNWIKYKGYEFNEGEIKQIRAFPKDISYKVKLMDYKQPTKLVGTIYKIDSNTVDIEYNNIVFADIPKNHVEGSISINSEVSFYKVETLYADFDITRKGYLECYINTNGLKTSDFSSLVTNIQGYINEFITRIYTTESLQSYRIFDTKAYSKDLQVYTRSNTSKISNLIYEYNLKLPKEVKITYDMLYRISKLLYPYVIINDEPFNKDDTIQYFDLDKKLWINGKIMKYNIDNQYDITLFDTRYNETTNRLVENVDVTSLKPLESKYSKRMFELIFKKIPEFNPSTPITNFIIKLANSGMSGQNILDRIMYTFNIDKDSATSMISTTLSESGVVSLDRLIEKLDSELGISIKIDYVPHLLSTQIDNINIYIQNTKSIDQVKDIYKFLNYFFDLYLVITKNGELEIFNDIVEFNKDNTDDSLENHNASTKDTLQPDIVPSDLDIGDVCDLDDLDCLDDLLDSDVIVAETEEIDQEAITEVYNKKIKAEIEKSLTQTYGKQIKNPVLAKLYETDPNLFKWDPKDKTKDNSYSRQCQSSRQPSVLTQEEKDKIDSKNPFAYATTSIDIDCRNKDSFKSLKNDQDPKCKALYYGTTAENKRWYICPRIMDLSDNTPLTWKDMDYTPINGKTFVSLDDEHPEYWRLDKNTTTPKFNKTTGKIVGIEKMGKDILEYKPSYNGKTIIGDSGVITPKESIMIMSKSETRSYPGFLNPGSHPNNLAAPCCFNNSSKKVSSVLGDKSTKGLIEDSNTYIQSWGRQLEKNRLGLLPEIVYDYIHNADIPTTGNIIASKGKNWFLRQGLVQDNESFLRLIADFQNTTLDKIKSNIIKNLTIKKYVNINKGNLSVEFENMGKQSSFQNFLEYTISNQYKQYKYYYELLVNTGGFAFDKDNNILLILDYTRVDGKDTVNLLCPYFSNKNNSEGGLTRVYLAIKYGNVFEPIYKYSGSLSTDRYFLSTDEHIRDLVTMFNNQCHNVYPSRLISVAKAFKKYVYKEIVSVSRVYNILNLLSTDNPEYAPKILVRDDYNKIIGIFLKNLVIVPVYPQNIVDDIDGIDTRGINVNKFQTVADLDTTIETYRNLKQLTKNIIDIEIVRFFTDTNNNITGYVTNTGIYISLDKVLSRDKYKNRNIDIVRKNYNHIDNVIKNYINRYNELIYKKPLSYTGLLQTLDDLVGKYPKFSIETYVTNNGITSSLLILRCGLYLEIEETNINSFTSYEKTSTIGNINNLFSEYISNAIELSRVSDYKIPCLPVRGLMNDKKIYDRIVLETGVSLPISKPFSIDEKENQKYKILYIIENPTIDRLFGEAIIDKSIFMNSRIQTIEKHRYLSDLSEILRLELYNFFQNPSHIGIKQFFKSVLEYIGLNINQKRRILYPIFNLIFNSITLPKHTSDTKYPKLNLKQVCSNSDCDLEYCVTENTKYEMLNDINTYIDITMTGFYNEKDSSKISDFKNRMQLIEKKDTEKGFEIYNKLVDILNKKDSLCKIEIIENIEKDRAEKLQNIILEDIVRNKYKRNHILDTYKTTISKDRFVANEPFEIIILSDDINSNIVNDLYSIAQKKYYSDIVPFSDSELDIDIDIDTNIGLVDTCTIGNSTSNTVKITDMRKVSRNISMNNNITNLGVNSYAELYKKIMKMNVDIDKCIVNEKSEYIIRILGNKKKIL